jgi:hypothetical protein
MQRHDGSQSMRLFWSVKPIEMIRANLGKMLIEPYTMRFYLIGVGI